MKARRARKTASQIIDGRPVKIRALVERPDGASLVLMKWTTGDCYLPYELAKRYFPDLLFAFLTAKPREFK